MSFRSTTSDGFTLVELLVTAALVAVVFGGLFASMNSMIKLISSSKAKAGATALAVEQVEYLRSLAYVDVGTVGGVPAGAIASNGTTTLNGIQYNVRTLVEYVDDQTDGFGAADENGILADYKRAKVEVSWWNRTATSSVSLVTSIMPVGIENTAGGGTIRVNVFDATALPVASAAVHFYNDSGTTTIDTVRYTNNDGIAYLAGAPAGANYQMTITKSGDTTDGTIVPSAANPNPTTQPIAVAEGAVSTMNFQIDQVSAVTVHTVSPAVTNSFSDDFTSDAQVVAYASTTRSGTGVVLTDVAGMYDSFGTVRSTTTSPAAPERWQAIGVAASSTASTSVRVSLYYDQGGSMALVPDSVLPGNSVGFTGGPVDLSTLDVTTYHSLALQAALTTIDQNETPTLHGWSLSYVESEAVVPTVDFTLHGSKVIGTAADTSPIYKADVVGTTDSVGSYTLSNIDWGSYTLQVTDAAYQAIEICPVSPFAVAPAASVLARTTVIPYVGTLLRVAVTDAAGATIPNATVELTKGSGGYDTTQSSSLCGQTAFYGGGLAVGTDYTLTVSAPGFLTSVVPDTIVSSTSTATVILTQ